MDHARSTKHEDHLFLLEFLSPHARLADVWARAEAIRRIGSLAGAAFVRTDGSADSHALPSDLRSLASNEWPGELEKLSRTGTVTTLVVAGDDSASRLRQVRAHWRGAVSTWPTRLGADGAINDRVLRCAVAARPRAPRTRVPLWDGPYLLAPAALTGEAGRAWIEAFAAVAAEEETLDLVILAEPDRDLQRLAQARSVSLRAHWIGPSPLRAECLWMACASALLVGGELPDAATLLRALETSAPLLLAGNDPAAVSLAQWLSGHGAALALGRPAVAPMLGAIRSAIARSPEARLSASRAAALSARHLPERMAPALRASLIENSEAARRAA